MFRDYHDELLCTFKNRSPDLFRRLSNPILTKLNRLSKLKKKKKYYLANTN